MNADLPNSYFWTTLSLTTIITSLLAFALLHLCGVNGWAGWRWLFFVEGLITLTIGLISFINMPASIVQTKTWFRPKGWFTDKEVAIVVNRVLRDDPSKGDMHNRQAITPRRLWGVLKEYDLWPMYAIGLICFIPQGPVNAYLTLTLRSLGFDPFKTNLLTIPAVCIYPTYPYIYETYPTNTASDCLPHHLTPYHNPHFRVSEPAGPNQRLAKYLDPALHYCAAILAGRYRQCLGHLRTYHGSLVLSVLPYVPLRLPHSYLHLFLSLSSSEAN